MSMYETFETNPEKEREGVWLDYGDFRVRVAHAGHGNQRYVKYAEKVLKPVRRAMEAGSLDHARSDALMIDIYAKTVILDWEVKNKDGDWKQGIEARDGSTLPFTVDNVIATLKALRNLFVDIQQQANQITHFRAAEMEEDSGNS